MKGFTARHPGIPPHLRGTYAGFAHPAAIEHLQRLGVTAVELLPVHQFVHAQHLVDRGLSNYWGYDSIGYLPSKRLPLVAEARAGRARVQAHSPYGEGNRDGTDDNRSWNCGAEGPTDDEAVLALRGRQQRNLLTTLFLSQGVPMLSGGDEFGRTQAGNNNAYCQDNELSWFDWENVDTALLAFTQALVAFRQHHPIFRRRRFFQGRPIRGNQLSDIGWFRPDGAEMNDEDWRVRFAKSLAVFLNGDAIPDPGRHNEPIGDDCFYLLCNADAAPLEFVLPGDRWGELWVEALSTANRRLWSPDQRKAGDRVAVPGRALVVLRRL